MAKRGKAATGSKKANVGCTYQLEPTPEQAKRIREWGHTRRAIYNLALEQRQVAWRYAKRPLWSKDETKDLTEVRAEIDWIKDFPAQAAQQVLRDLDQAYKNCWNPAHPATAPRFLKRESRLRFRLPGQAVEVRHVDRKRSEVWAPKLGWVVFRRHRPLHGKVRSATFSYTPGRGWSVSLGIAAKDVNAPANGKPDVGVDFGVACSAFLSDEDSSRLMPPTSSQGEKRRLLGLEQRKARQLTYAKSHTLGVWWKHVIFTTSPERWRCHLAWSAPRVVSEIPPPYLGRPGCPAARRATRPSRRGTPVGYRRLRGHLRPRAHLPLGAPNRFSSRRCPGVQGTHQPNPALRIPLAWHT